MTSVRRKSTFGNADGVGTGGKVPTSRLSANATSGGVTSITDRLGLNLDDFDIGDTMEEKELKELERKLNDEVDEDLFEEPKRFNTLHRVIDVLGLQMIDDAATTTGGGMSKKNQESKNIEKNPAYQNLRTQQKIVEGAIEHMAVIHCADLNGSVIQVGRVARQFSDAVSKVRYLRKQVRDIQETLGANEAATSTAAPGTGNTAGSMNTAKRTTGPSNAASMSLRELWLKKLECEAALALLDRLDVVRAAPAQFDLYVHHTPCRIGAATVTLTRALAAMFSDDIAQVQALHKIMEQLLLRKQIAEEIVWDTIADVLYLRTGNGLFVIQQEKRRMNDRKNEIANYRSGMSISGQSVGSESKRSRASNMHRFNRVSVTSGAGNIPSGSASVISATSGIVNPFVGHHTTWKSAGIAVLSPTADITDPNHTNSNRNEDDDDDASYDSNCSGASLFSIDDDVDEDKDDQNTTSNETKKSMISETSNFVQQKRMMIPIPIVEAELDLEADERRCLEEIALSGMMASAQINQTSSTMRQHHRLLPRYADPILALRILVECLTQLGRCDDAERVILDGLGREIRQIVQREQARTFQRLEKRQERAFANGGTIRFNTGRSGNIAESLKDFRRHLTGLLSAFGCVLVRIAHLAEVLRIRIVSYFNTWPRCLRKYPHGLLIIKLFVTFLFQSSDRELMQKVGSPSSMLRSVITAAGEMMQREIKEFLEACLKENDSSLKDMMDSNVGSGSKAYESGLFSLGIADTGPRQQVSSTATRSNVMEMTTTKFVRSVLIQKTKTTPQARHALSFRRSVARWTSEVEALSMELATLTNEDTTAPSFKSGQPTAISYLDHLIQNDLLPVLQEEAVNGTVMGLERRDGFDPVLGRGLYATANSNEPQDIEMCIACSAMHRSTGPLFMALHRLPRGGEMYLPLVAVLEHVLLTFISRVKKQVDKICEKKTAMVLINEVGKGAPLAMIMERRRPCALLSIAYADGDAMDASDGPKRHGSSGLVALAPSESDTASRLASNNNIFQNEPLLEDVGDGVDGEENLMLMELQYMDKYFDFNSTVPANKVVVCSDEELMKAACLAHSLLKLSSLLDSRLKIRGSSGYNRALTSTRTLREAIKAIKLHGLKTAKFCRLDVLMQIASRMSKVAHSSTLVARDAVRIPSMVNDLGEYLTSTSDNLREASGNAVTAYAFSSLEQYIPYCLMQTVRVIASGNGVVAKTPLTMNGIEALDRSGSVLYRDLKGATSFDNSSWDMELAAISFERSASFMAMMELEMEELVAYYTANHDEFPEDDFMIMFAMTGPRRRGDIGRYHMTKKSLGL